jgi:hypothetical protein
VPPILLVNLVFNLISWPVLSKPFVHAFILCSLLHPSTKMPTTRRLWSPFTIFSFLLLLSGLSATAASASATDEAAPSTQFCTTSTKEDVNTDLCFAFASSHNETTDDKDLSLHLSARFPAPGTGWAGVGVGSVMSGSLMFVMYPSKSDDAVVFSIRTTTVHNAPVALSPSSLAGKNGPDVHVTRKWVDEGGYSNVLVSCFGCDKWSGSTLDVRSVNQSWIWAWNRKQVMSSASEKVGLQKHGDKGLCCFTFLLHICSFPHSLD